MQKLLNFLVCGMKLERPGNVLAYSLLSTAFTVTVTVSALVLGMMAMAPGAPAIALAGIAAIGLVIAGAITLPVAIVLLSILHIQVRTLHDVRALVRFDHLTGVLGRAAFMASLDTGIARGGSVLMIDADHFKQLNDQFGHATGDQALRLIADAISHTVGGRGETGRLGGEEFAVFMPGCSLSEGEDMAARINRQVAAIDLEAIRGRRGLTVSIGVAHASAAMRSEDLLAFADTLLYEAKRSGRNRYASVRTASVMETANGKNPAFAPAA